MLPEPSPTPAPAVAVSLPRAATPSPARPATGVEGPVCAELASAAVAPSPPGPSASRAASEPCAASRIVRAVRVERGARCVGAFRTRDIRAARDARVETAAVTDGDRRPAPTAGVGRCVRVRRGRSRDRALSGARRPAVVVVPPSCCPSGPSGRRSALIPREDLLERRDRAVVQRRVGRRLRRGRRWLSGSDRGRAAPERCRRRNRPWRHETPPPPLPERPARASTAGTYACVSA